MTQFLGRFRLAHSISALCFLIVLFLMGGNWLASQLIKTNVVKMQQQQLVDQVTSFGEVARLYPHDKARLRELIYAARWGKDNDGYLFLIQGGNNVLLDYPVKPSLEGGQLPIIKLTEGGTLQQAVSDVSRDGVARLIHYYYNLPGSSQIELKASYLYPLGVGQAVLVAGTYLGEAHALIGSVEGELTGTVIVCGMVILMMMLIFSKYIRVRIHYLKQSMVNMAKGEMSQVVHLKGQDEFAHLAVALNHCQSQQIQMIGQQMTLTNQVANSSAQTQKSVNKTHSLLSEQLDYLTQLSRSTEEMVISIRDVVHHASVASNQATTTDERAHQGHQRIEQSLQQVRTLCQELESCANSVTNVQHQVESIRSIVGTINSISEQTNLLALNAAIEAARAGSVGRGFAVVADEVRHLAARTQSATQDIEKMINQLQLQSEQAVVMTQQSLSAAHQTMQTSASAGDEFSSIMAAISQLRDNNHQIAAAAEQQESVAESMSQNLNQLSDELHVAGEELDKATQETGLLQNQAEELDLLVNKYQLSS
ncbi:methyl-accepting chemotaxis protein [Celerinatantimonas yamalensis]|uniref:Methyl-accepting chemotaxis protein n=1 Tax=Celerinatantimonas yamalensis TaxID=559956 RepID=A0ABW9GAL4_9GAMM